MRLEGATSYRGIGASVDPGLEALQGSIRRRCLSSESSRSDAADGAEEKSDNTNGVSSLARQFQGSQGIFEQDYRKPAPRSPLKFH